MDLLPCPGLGCPSLPALPVRITHAHAYRTPWAAVWRCLSTLKDQSKIYPLLLLTVGSVMSCYALASAHTDVLDGALLQAGPREHAGSGSLPSRLSGCSVLQPELGRREIPAAVPTGAKCLPLCAAFVKRERRCLVRAGGQLSVGLQGPRRHPRREGVRGRGCKPSTASPRSACHPWAARRDLKHGSS